MEASDDFEDDKLNLMWQWLGNYKESFYSLTERKGFLRMYALNPSGKAEPILWESPNVLTQKLVCPFFKATASLNVTSLSENEQAGMVMMGGHYAYIAVRIINGKKTAVFAEAYDEGEHVKERFTVLKELSDSEEKIYITFVMEDGGDAPVFKMYYSLDGKEEINVPTTFMPSDHTWVGAKIGLFANVMEAKEKGGYADFEYIHVTAL